MRNPPPPHHARSRVVGGTRRWHTWIFSGEQLECPDGHRLTTNSMKVDHDTLICKDRSGGSECGRRVYFINFKHGVFYLAEVTVAEGLHMRDVCEDREAVLRYLRGITTDGRVA